jgi:hypothetical protein
MVLQKIEPKEFTFNARVVKSGRLVELMELQERLHLAAGNGFRGSTWGSFLNTKRYKRLVYLEEKVLRHIKWYVRLKFPKIPRMYYYRIDGGWLILPWTFKDK